MPGHPDVRPVGALCLLVCLLGAPLRAQEPVQRTSVTRRGPIAQPMLRPETWETELDACVLEFKTRPRCLTELLLRVPPSQVALFAPEAERLTNELIRWLGKDELWTAYRVKTLALGEWMSVRHYVLEDGQGNVRLLRVSFRRIVGEWWLHAFRLVERADVEKELGLE